MKSVIRISILAAVVVMLNSCCACRKGSPIIGNLEESVWQLTELLDKQIENSGITLRFDANEKMVYGTAPCNNFFGGYSLFEDPKQNIKIGNIGATRKYCPDSEVEDKFTAALSSITLLKIDGENLLMINADNKIVAVLQAKKQ